ncbi:hypothetical protein F5B20DRAFT_369850 [Whalleya microplaca]|nr:hypothetical protein F5B20DRAFT_369850 [Whalleya microplaca]
MLDREAVIAIDTLSSEVASKAHEAGVFHLKETTMVTDSRRSNELEENLDICLDSTLPPHPSLNPGANVGGRSELSDTVRLFRSYNKIVFRWAYIGVHVTSLRRRQHKIRDSASYFSISIQVTPRFMSTGFSIWYTSAPDEAGYYSICPSILTFCILPADSPVGMVLCKDDVDTLRYMIMNREVCVRDKTHHGRSLLQIAVACGSLQCSRYLLNEAGMTMEAAFEWSDIHNTLILLCGLFQKAKTCRDIIQVASDISDLVAQYCEWKLDWHLGSFGWHYFMPTKEKDVIVITRALRKRGFNVEPFWWDSRSHDLDYYPIAMGDPASMLKICLEAGGDPNAILDGADNEVPLEFAMHLLYEMRVSDREMLKRRAGTSVRKSDPEARAHTNLLVMLINAGADIYYTREADGDLLSLTYIAYNCKVADLWKEALIECGLDPDEVFKEDWQRKVERSQLRSANRTGVDVDAFMDRPSTYGLRHRARAGGSVD